MTRPVNPRSRVMAKLNKQLNAVTKIAKARKRKRYSKAIATIKAKYTNLG